MSGPITCVCSFYTRFLKYRLGSRGCRDDAPTQQRAGNLGINKNTRPLTEDDFGHHDDGGALVDELAHQTEQQLARYLLTLFAQTPDAEDLRRAKLIADVFADFERLLAEPK
jgi:hypothetical protein